MHLPFDSMVYIVDDDIGVREGMAWLLRTRRLLSEPYDSAEAFLDMLQQAAQVPHATPLPQQAGCILLDVRMPGLSGLALFEQLQANGLAQAWPVIFLTGHADVPTAVDSVKRGAFDFAKNRFLTTPWWTAWNRPCCCRKSAWWHARSKIFCNRAWAN